MPKIKTKEDKCTIASDICRIALATT